MYDEMTGPCEVAERHPRDRASEPQPIGDVLTELLAQYQSRFPELELAVVRVPAEAA